MSTTLIRGKYVLCKVNDQDEVEMISDGAVFQRDGEIVDVGKYDSLKARYAADEEIGSDQHMVLPGLVNAHQHARGVPYVLLGSPAAGLEHWIVKMMDRRPVDIYLENMYCIARLIESGVTTVLVSHFPRSPHYEEEVRNTLKAYQDGGIRVAFAFGTRNQNHLVYQDDEKFLSSLPPSLATRARKHLAYIKLSEEEYFDLFARLYKEYGGNTSSRVRILHGPSDLPWCSDELLIRIKQSADEYQTGIHAHMQQTIYGKMYALNTFGKTPIEHVYDIGFVGPRVSFAHCMWATERDIELLAKSGTSVCYAPSGNLKSGAGITPINRMLEKGVNVALGMDSSAFNDDEDMLQELKMCAYLHRTAELGGPSPTPGQILKMATANGAKVTLFSDQVGTLEKGKRADIVLVNLKNITEPYIDPEVSIVSALLARGKGSDVDTVMIDGEIVMRNRKLTRINRDEIVAGVRESLSRALKPDDIERKRLAQELSPYIFEFYRDWQMPEARPYYMRNSKI